MPTVIVAEGDLQGQIGPIDIFLAIGMLLVFIGFVKMFKGKSSKRFFLSGMGFLFLGIAYMIGGLFKWWPYTLW